MAVRTGFEIVAHLAAIIAVVLLGEKLADVFARRREIVREWVVGLIITADWVCQVWLALQSDQGLRFDASMSGLIPGLLQVLGNCQL